MTAYVEHLKCDPRDVLYECGRPVHVLLIDCDDTILWKICPTCVEKRSERRKSRKDER